MKKFKIKSSKITILAIALLLAVSSLFVFSINGDISAFAAESEIQMYEEKIYWKGDIDENFDDSSVLVVMDKRTGGINKRHTESFFGNFSKEAVNDLSYVNGDIKSIDSDTFRQILQIELPIKSKKNVINVISQLEKIEGILWAGPNHYYTSNAKPANAGGTSYPDLWGMHGRYGIDAEYAWDITTGNRNAVRVGVLDTGIANHPDLNANLVAGWDFYNNNDITNDDPTGHGTHVAGTIGATGNNTNGVAGVAWNVQLVPLQAVYWNETEKDWLINGAAAINAINWARDNNVDIINFSSGGTSENEALKYAIGSFPGLFVCAAGNDNRNNDIIRHYPSEYSRGQTISNRVISVGAINSAGNKTTISNYGANSVSLFAPGHDILSTAAGGGYYYNEGTSMAAPHVTGTAALMFAYYLTKPHNMTREKISIKIKSTIMKEAYVESNLIGLCASGGRLYASDAVSEIPFTVEAFNNFGYVGSTYFWNGRVDMTVPTANGCTMNPSNIMVFNGNTAISFELKTVLYSNALTAIYGTVSFHLKNSSGEIVQIEGSNTHVSSVNVNMWNVATLDNTTFTINPLQLSNDTYTLTLTSVMHRASWTDPYTKTFTFIVQKPTACVAEGTLVTLADGSQKPVELLTPEDLLLVWNHHTGTFDTAPIILNDNEPNKLYEIIHLYFSDGSEVKVIDEHAFWNATLNRYVFIRREESAQYIGDWFNKQTTDENGEIIWKNVQLVDVQIYNDYTTAWSPVTFAHLNFYANGMLSMPGATEGLINIFEVDADTLQYNQAAFQADIQTYGLFEYADFEEIIPEIVFEAFQGRYLAVSLGKGLITWEGIEALIVRYSAFWQE